MDSIIVYLNNELMIHVGVICDYKSVIIM